MTDDRTRVRRVAVVAVCEPAARSTIARVVDGILSTLPLAFEAMRWKTARTIRADTRSGGGGPGDEVRIDARVPLVGVER